MRLRMRRRVGTAIVKPRINAHRQRQDRTVTADVKAASVAAQAASRVLLVGGYGNVGQRIARLLDEELGERLLIGGRDRRRATRFAATLRPASLVAFAISTSVLLTRSSSGSGSYTISRLPSARRSSAAWDSRPA